MAAKKKDKPKRLTVVTRWVAMVIIEDVAEFGESPLKRHEIAPTLNINTSGGVSARVASVARVASATLE